jgi:hypothetical protein
MRTIAAGITPDIGSVPYPLAIPAYTLQPNYLARLIYTAADTSLPSPRTVLIDAQPLSPTWMINHPTQEAITW